MSLSYKVFFILTVGQEQLSTDFVRWVDNLKNDFSQLSTSQKSEALFLMHNMSTPDTLSEVSHLLIGFITKDFVNLLPPKVVSKILSYLDGHSLVCCATVSKNWRSIVINNTELWTKLVKQLCLCEDVVERVTHHQLYMRFRRSVQAVKSMDAALEFPSIAEYSCHPNLPSVKNMKSTPSGNLIMSYSVRNVMFLLVVPLQRF